MSLHSFAPCPDSDNCVSSDASTKRHVIEPFQLRVPMEEAWLRVRDIVSKMPRTQITVVSGDYLHAECRSRVFRFVDDLELQLRPSDNSIAVRSASRLGLSDLGVNRRRVERLRALFVKQGLVSDGAFGPD